MSTKKVLQCEAVGLYSGVKNRLEMFKNALQYESNTNVVQALKQSVWDLKMREFPDT